MNQRLLENTPYFLSFFWGLCLLASFVGWGRLLNRLLFTKDRADWGLCAVWGMGITIAIGGVLNLAWMISVQLILIQVAVGMIIWAVDTALGGRKLREGFLHLIRNNRYGYADLIVVVILSILIVLQFGGWVAMVRGSQPWYMTLNAHDDAWGYLMFPLEMLENGSIGRLPFSTHRLGAGLGGQSYLHALVLAQGDIKNIHLIDPGVSLLIVWGLVLGFCREKRLNWLAAAPPLLFLMFDWIPIVNTSALMVAIALIVGLYRTLEWPGLKEDRPAANGLALAVVASALCSTKATMIACCALFFPVTYFFYALRRRFDRRVFYEVAVLVGATFLLLLPWMISLHQSSGTYLFPILGKGYRGETYGYSLDPNHELTSAYLKRIMFGDEKTTGAIFNPLFISVLLLGIPALLVRPWRLRGREAGTAFYLATAASFFAIFVSVQGLALDRYMFPILSAAIVILLLTILGDLPGRRGRPALWVSIVVLAVAIPCFPVGLKIKDSNVENVALINNITTNIKDNKPFCKPEEIDAVSRMQAVIPPGQPFFARVEFPYMLDLHRNGVQFIPGTDGTSPPPGIPMFKGGEALANYLLSLSVRYVAFSYKTEALYARNAPYLVERTHPDHHPYERFETLNTFNLSENLLSLGETRKRIFDDGNNFVLDLTQPAGK